MLGHYSKARLQHVSPMLLKHICTMLTSNLVLVHDIMSEREDARTVLLASLLVLATEVIAN